MVQCLSGQLFERLAALAFPEDPARELGQSELAEVLPPRVAGQRVATFSDRIRRHRISAVD